PNVMERITSTRQTNRGSTMYEVNLHVKFTFFGADGTFFVASGWGEGTDMGDKATSKAMTMAFKYVLAETFALATAEVSDADASSPEETVRHESGSTQGSPGRPPRSVNRTSGAGSSARDSGSRVVPKSWKELEAALTEYDTGTWEAW